MTVSVNITKVDIIHHLRLTCQISQISEQIMINRIIIHEAKEHGIIATDAELQEAADGMRLIYGLHDAQATWSWLEKNNLSLDDFEEAVQANLLSSKLAKHLFFEKAKAHFAENQMDYMGAIFYEVIFSDEDLAWDIFYSIKEKDVTFFEVAKKYIQNEEMARIGGYRGFVSKKEMKAEIASSILAANSSQLLKPIMTAKGLHLIYVEKVVKPDLNDEIHYQIISQLFQEWIKDIVEIHQPEIELT